MSTKYARYMVCCSNYDITEFPSRNFVAFENA